MASDRPDVRIVIPLYRPDEEVLGNLETAARQAPVIAVDDGSGPAFAGLLQAVEASGCVVIRQATNVGIAKALNAGIDRALEDGADYVLTLDQDTVLDDGAVEALLDSFARLPSGTNVAAIGPGRTGDGLSGSHPVTYRGTEGPLPWLVSVAEALQSGMLIPAGALRELGLLRESLVIDGVDTEFCLRARRSGFSVLVDTRVGMRHRLGAGAASPSVRVGPWRPTASGHSALRRYYITRNRLWLLRRFALREPRWASMFVRRFVMGTLLAVTIENDRRRKLRAVALGVRDAVRGRTGLAPPALRS